MKKIILFAGILFLNIALLYSQAPANRATNTIIADALAQMPAQNNSDYTQQLTDLLRIGEEGIMQLVEMMVPLGKGDNAPIEYALSGLANIVTSSGMESERLMVSNGLMKAIEKVSDRETKAFLIRLLEIAGKEEAIPFLTSLSNNKELSEPAIAALASIKKPQPEEVTQTEKEVNELRVKALKEGQFATASAALDALMKMHPEKINGLLKDALKNKNREYRGAALNSALNQATPELIKELAKTFKKASPELKLELTNSFISLQDCPKGKELLNAVSSDLLIAELKNKNTDVRDAVAEFLAKSGRPEAITALANLLTSNNTQDIDLAKNALLYTKGTVADEIAPLIEKAGEPGKVAILNLLASRKADAYANLVFEQTNSTSAIVSEAAFNTLKDVVGKNDLDKLYALLENADEAETNSIQQAVISALRTLSPDKRTGAILHQISVTPSDSKSKYYTILSACETETALRFIIDSFNEQNGIAKERAFQALLNWPNFSVAKELLTICKNNPSSNYFNRALDRYIVLASSSQLTGENQRLMLTNALDIAQTSDQKNKIVQRLGNTNTFLGMLLAGKYLDDQAIQESAAQAVMKIALANPGFYGENIKSLLQKSAKVLNNPDADYQRKAISAFLAGTKDSAGYESLYNGKDLTGWQGIVENPMARAKMNATTLAAKQAKADETARAHWIPKGEILEFDGAGWENLCTIKKYGDFEMYVDWKLDPQSPEADGGIYLRGTPQVQIWDISRTNVGAQVGSGGLYNNQKNPSKPLVVADNELGEWNTFYIKMIGDRVTVKLNGVLVVDNVILENYWNRSLPIPVKDQIELQAHKSIMYYRNIYVKELESPELFELSAEEKKEGFRVLFDGSNMHQWVGNMADYRMENGTISVYPSQSFGGNLFTKDEFANFIFRFEFQLTPGANNGLGIRTPMEGDPAYVGMELQILDDDAAIYRDLEVYQYHGSIYGVISAKRGALKPLGEWNYQEVIANGDHIKITLNGVVIVDGNIREASKNGTVDRKEHPGLLNKKGHIGFLGHGSQVKFKNIRIKELKP